MRAYAFRNAVASLATFHASLPVVLCHDWERACVTRAVPCVVAGIPSKTS